MAGGGATCARHRRRSRVAACGACGDGLCAGCVVHTPVGVKCVRCTGAKATGVQAGPSRAGSFRQGAATAARRRPWAVCLAAGGLVLLAVAGVNLTSGGPGPVDVGGVAAPPAVPLTERHTTFVGPGGHSLGGTLTLPGAGHATNVPAVVIVPGLGAVDRDSVVVAGTPDEGRDALVTTLNGTAAGAADPLFKDLSVALANAGVASFRYDRRGTASSPLAAGRTLSFDDEVGDARSALALLAERQEVGDAPLGVIGHDSGGVVALRLAAAHTRVRVAVAVSTPGRPLGEVLVDDLARTRGPEVAEQFRAAVAMLTASGEAGPPEDLHELLRPIFDPGHDGYLRTVLAMDPSAEAVAVAVPVLFVRGGADTRVTAADTDRLRGALEGSEVMVGRADANHNLALSPIAHGHANLTGSSAPARDGEVLSGIAGWLENGLSG